MPFHIPHSKNAFVSVALILVTLLACSSQIQTTTASDITRTIAFKTAYGTITQSEKFTISTLTYWRALPHPSPFTQYPNGSYDMHYSQYIETKSVEGISKDVASVAKLGEEDVANTVLSFVQNLGYISNNYTIQYTLYPVETLLLGGIYDDLSVLYASMMISQGFKLVFILYPQENPLHVSVGVHLSSIPKHAAGNYSSYTINGLDYYIAETTHTGYQIGDIPKNLAGQRHYFEKATEPARTIYQTTQTQSAPSFGAGSYISPTTVVAGGMITANFYVTNTDSKPIQARLEMSIRKVGTGSGILDSSHDAVVSITPGTNVYTRSFTVPQNTSPGNYEWILAISAETPGTPHEYANTGWQRSLTVNSH